MNMEEKILQVPIEDIIPNRFQPRLTFDDAALQELAASIKEHGIIQPLVLRKLGDKYEIIAGERRYKASQIAGLTTVPAVISDIDDDKSAEVALVENIQRRNLTAIEEAKSYKNILDRGYLTQEQLAEKLGISQSTIANKMRLLNLCDEVQDALLKEKISERHARALLAIKDPTEQIKWLNKIINDRLTVRQLDIEIKKSLNNAEDEDDSSIPIVELTPNIDEIKENALDINPAQGLHDIESMLKPSMPGEKEYNLNEPVEEVETLDIDETITPSAPEKMPNKFFNFLEDEAANMNDGSSIDDLSLNNNQIIPESNQQNNNNVISVDNTTLDEDIVPVTPLGDASINDNANIVNNASLNNNIYVDNAITNNDTNQILSDNNTDNNLIQENQMISNGNSIIENQIIPETNNINEINNEPVNDIIEVKNDIKNDVFDPMSMVNTLEPDYEEKIKEQSGTDLKTAIERIRETRDLLESMGFVITMDEADTDGTYNISINIQK